MINSLFKNTHFWYCNFYLILLKDKKKIQVGWSHVSLFITVNSASNMNSNTYSEFFEKFTKSCLSFASYTRVKVLQIEGFVVCFTNSLETF